LSSTNLVFLKKETLDGKSVYHLAAFENLPDGKDCSVPFTTETTAHFIKRHEGIPNFPKTDFEYMKDFPPEKHSFP